MTKMNLKNDSYGRKYQIKKIKMLLNVITFKFLEKIK